MAGQPGFGQLFHIERVDIQGDQASVSAFYQRRADIAGGYDCELKRSGEVWTIQACVPSARNDEIDIHLALYQALGGYITFPSTAGAYCMSRGPGAQPADPAGVTLFRMIRSSDVKHFPVSQCTTSGVPLAPGNTEAIGLHIERVEIEGGRAIADASVHYKQTVAELQCEVTKVGQRFASSTCWPAAQPVLTEDDFGIRAALYKYIAVPELAHPDIDAWCISEQHVDATQSGPGDPPPAVMSRLAGDSREFVPTSACARVRLTGTLSSAYHTPSDELAGWVHIDQIVRQPGFAEARVTATYPYGGYLWHCVVEPVSQKWEVKSCQHWAAVD